MQSVAQRQFKAKIVQVSCTRYICMSYTAHQTASDCPSAEICYSPVFQLLLVLNIIRDGVNISRFVLRSTWPSVHPTSDLLRSGRSAGLRPSSTLLEVSRVVVGFWPRIVGFWPRVCWFLATCLPAFGHGVRASCAFGQ